VALDVTGASSRAPQAAQYRAVAGLRDRHSGQLALSRVPQRPQ